METPEDIAEWVERYVNETLSSEEQTEFRQKVQEDSTFAERVHSPLHAMAAIRMWSEEHRKQEFRAQFQELAAEQEALSVRKFPRYWPWLVAASVGILLLTIWWADSSGPQATMEELYTEYYQVPNAPEARSENQSDSLLQFAHVQFNQGQFQVAIPVYEELKAQLSDNQLGEVHFFLGISFLESNETLQAISALEQVNGRYAESASWYRVLAWLKIGNQDSTEVGVNRIILQPNHFYKDQAEELVRSLGPAN